MRLKFPIMRNTIALDIQSHAVFALQLKRSNRSLILQHAKMWPLPNDVVIEGKIINWQQLQSLLQYHFRKQDWQHSKVILHLPATLVWMNTLNLPNGLAESGIEQEIMRHVAQDIPGISDKLAIDYAIESTREGYHTYAYVATKAAYLAQYRHCMKTLRLINNIIDLDVYALARAAMFALPHEECSTRHCLLILSGSTAYLIAFSTTHILIHYHWPAAQSDVQLPMRLQACQELLQRKLTCLLVCAAPQWHNLVMLTCAALTLAVKNLDPFANIAMATKSAFLTPEQRYDFLIALGLALRGG